MNRVVSLATYLESYNLSKDVVMTEIDNDRKFYDKYIDWGKNDKETIISPKALARLGEKFNENNSIPITSDEKVIGTIDMCEDVNIPVTAETVVFESDKKNIKKEKTVKMSEFMDIPVEDTKEKVKTPAKPRKRRNKLGITKQFLQEHGFAEENNIKQLRLFLMSDGIHKAEDVALMSDQEVKDSFTKDYYIIKAAEGTYIIKRQSIMDIINDIYMIEDKTEDI